MNSSIGSPVRPCGHDAFPARPAKRRNRTPAHSSKVWDDHLRLAHDEDPAALERLVCEYERYARSLAARMHRGHESREDLDQIALEALVVSLKRFDPARGLPFPAFATPTIVGAIRRHYRDHGWLIRVPRRVHEFASAQREATERLAKELQRVPTDDELAEDLDVAPAELQACVAAIHARDARSLDGVFDGDVPLGERVGCDDTEFALAEDRMAAMAAIRQLDRPTRRLLYLYFFEERTQTQIAAALGVSQMQVSRQLSKALRQVRLSALAHTAQPEASAVA